GGAAVVRTVVVRRVDELTTSGAAAGEVQDDRRSRDPHQVPAPPVVIRRTGTGRRRGWRGLSCSGRVIELHALDDDQEVGICREDVVAGSLRRGLPIGGG